MCIQLKSIDTVYKDLRTQNIKILIIGPIEAAPSQYSLKIIHKTEDSYVTCLENPMTLHNRAFEAIEERNELAIIYLEQISEKFFELKIHLFTQREKVVSKIRSEYRGNICGVITGGACQFRFIYNNENEPGLENQKETEVDRVLRTAMEKIYVPKKVPSLSTRAFNAFFECLSLFSWFPIDADLPK